MAPTPLPVLTRGRPQTMLGAPRLTTVQNKGNKCTTSSTCRQWLPLPLHYTILYYSIAYCTVLYHTV